jgi:hypothetical protein
MTTSDVVTIYPSDGEVIDTVGGVTSYIHGGINGGIKLPGGSCCASNEKTLLSDKSNTTLLKNKRALRKQFELMTFSILIWDFLPRHVSFQNSQSVATEFPASSIVLKAPKYLHTIGFHRVRRTLSIPFITLVI